MGVGAICYVLVVKMSRKICEPSLRWILAVRRQGALHKYDPYNLNPKKFPETIGDAVACCGHLRRPSRLIKLVGISGFSQMLRLVMERLFTGI
jgi:hypothetical protein